MNTWIDTFNAAYKNCELRKRFSVSNSNDENVVKPPNSPIIKKARSSGEKASMVSEYPPRIPIIKHPNIFTPNVPTGKVSLFDKVWNQTENRNSQ